MNQCLIVTGASRGIGVAIARLATRNGYKVAVNYARDRESAEKIAKEISGVAIQADVCCEQDVIKMFEAAQAALGPIRALVNNAGITGGFARVEEIEAERVVRMLGVNVLGTMLCSREAVRRMSTRHGGCGGAIVNISSLAARTVTRLRKALSTHSRSDWLVKSQRKEFASTRSRRD